MSFQCPIIKKEIKVKGNLSDIYKENIKNETIETVGKASKKNIVEFST